MFRQVGKYRRFARMSTKQDTWETEVFRRLQSFDGNVRATDIAYEINLSVDSVYGALKRLRKKGLVESIVISRVTWWSAKKPTSELHSARSL